ncbi:prephenate dehydrogenase/arogenate dehydrogenase family protein [Ectothiorhodospiraceae bacterium WFHF3C12]|nr:prephenate dehydrogenase/arogenate dehydrogenase family protein [Ectothiorhodospiraceae bacterium WFHF3C12]
MGRLAIIGVGLIGGSLARALKARGLVDEVVGNGRNEATLRQAVDLGVIDRYELDPAAAVAGADMVVVCVPMGAMRAVLDSLRPGLADDAVVTDVGSAKGSVVRDAESAFGEVPDYLVPGHPIAGTERSGVEASFAELYRQRRVILTPLPHTRADAVARVRAMWEAAGADVVEMEVEHHDEILAATSHLPHMLAFGLVDTLSRWEGAGEIFEFAAGGFRDFTRIASSDPVMWRDICIANRGALLNALKRYRDDLDGLIEMVERGDATSIESLFRDAKATRDRFVERLENREKGARA